MGVGARQVSVRFSSLAWYILYGKKPVPVGPSRAVSKHLIKRNVRLQISGNNLSPGTHSTMSTINAMNQEGFDSSSNNK